MKNRLTRFLSVTMIIMLLSGIAGFAEAEEIMMFSQDNEFSEAGPEEEVLQVERVSSVTTASNSDLATLRRIKDVNELEGAGLRVGYYATSPLGDYTWYALIKMDISKLDKACDEVYFSVGGTEKRDSFAIWSVATGWQIDVYGVDTGDDTWYGSNITYSSAFGNKTPFESNGFMTLTPAPVASFTTDSSVVSEPLLEYYGTNSKYRVYKTDITEYIKAEMEKGSTEVTLMLSLKDHGSIFSNNQTAARFTFNDVRNGTGVRWGTVLPTISTVKYKKSENNKLKSVTVHNGILDGIFNEDTLEYNIAVKDENEQVSIDYVKSSVYSTVGENVVEGSLNENNPLRVTVVSQAGESRKYIFNLVKAEEIGYTENGTVTGSEIKYEEERKIISVIKNSSVNTRNAVITVLELKNNTVNKITLNFQNVNPGYSKTELDFMPHKETDALSIFVADCDSPFCPASEIVKTGAEDEFEKSDNAIGIYYKDVSKDELTVTGKWRTSPKELGAYILKGNINDFDGTNEKEIFVYAGGIITDAEGYYGFDVSMPSGGDYKAYIVDSEGNSEELEFYYSSPTEKKNAIEQLYMSANEEELKKKLNLSLSSEDRKELEKLYAETNGAEGQKDFVKLLGLSDEEFDNPVFESEFIRLLHLYMKKADSTDEFNSIYNDSQILAGICAGLTSDISVNNDKIGISEDIIGIYNDFSDNDKKSVTAEICDDGKFESFEEVRSSAESVIVLMSVNCLGNVDRISEIITSYGDTMLKLGAYADKYKKLTPNSRKSTVINAVIAKGPYANADSFAGVFKAETDKMLRAMSSGGSSGGGGGGGSSSGRGSAQSIEAAGVPESNLDADKINTKRICKFNDLKDYSWAENAIISLYENNIIDGVSENQYMPGKKLKREEFLKMADKLYKGNNSVNISFADVNENSWYYSYVCKAYGAGIIKGLGNGIFGIGNELTREDAAVIIVRILNPENRETDNSEFEDDSRISEYAKESVYYLKKIGVLSGDEKNNFNPENSLSRAEAAVLINNICKIKAE